MDRSVRLPCRPKLPSDEADEKLRVKYCNNIVTILRVCRVDG